MIKKILVLFFSVVTMTISAQEAEPEMIGKFSMSAYPKLKMSLGKKVYALVENGVLAEDGTFTATVAQLHNESFIRTDNPAEADFLVRYSKFEAVTPMAIDKFNPMHRKQKIKVGAFWVPTRTDPPGSSQMKPGQIPTQLNSSNKYYCAYMHLDFAFHVAITLPDKSIAYKEDVKLGKNFNSGWMPSEGAAVGKVQEEASVMTYEAVVSEYSSKKISGLVGATFMFKEKDIVCYFARPKKRSSNGAEYLEINDAVNKLKSGLGYLKEDEWNKEAFAMETEGVEEVLKTALDSVGSENYEHINKEIVSAIHYDLGIYYVFSKEFGKAAAQFKAVETDPKEKGKDRKFADAAALAKDCEKWQKEKDAYEALWK